MRYYIITTEKDNKIWTSDITDEHIKKIENEYGCKVVSIEWDGLDHSKRGSVEKNDENSRCMNDNYGSRDSYNRYGY